MRYKFSPEDCRKGGQARAKQASFQDACHKGFERTMETHPFFARKYLKKIIKDFNAKKRGTA